MFQCIPWGFFMPYGVTLRSMEIHQKPPRLIGSQEVTDLLPMAECIDVMATAMMAVSAGSVHVEPRLKESFAGGEGDMLLMRAESRDLGFYCMKQISLLPANAARGLPVIQGLISLFEIETGAPVAVLDGTAITALRTAAVSGLATRELAREDASSLGVLGTGVQAASHIQAIAAVRPLQQVIIWGRDPAKAAPVAEQQALAIGIPVLVAETPAGAAACDIICTVTASAQPVLMGEWVQPGSHINLVGSHSLDARETDTPLIQRSSVYIDLMEAVRAEAGDIMIPIQENAIGEQDIVGELGSLLAGDVRGRNDAAEITLFKSLGLAAQDLFAAQYVYTKLLSRS